MRILALALTFLLTSGLSATECKCFGDANKDALQKVFCNQIKEHVSSDLPEFAALTEYVKDENNDKKIWVYFELFAQDVDPAVGYGYFYEETLPIKFFTEMKAMSFKVLELGNYISEDSMDIDRIPPELRKLIEANFKNESEIKE